MRLIIQPDANVMAQWTANYIASKIIKANPTADKPFVLGLPTGSTPMPTYKALIDLNKRGVVSFENVVTFNMDEYKGVPADHPHSYAHFMWTHLFNHIDIKKENINLLDGMTEDSVAVCDAYEEKIKSYGGIDLFLAGVGPDGHLAFNEPGSSLSSRTRVKILNAATVEANARFFGNDKTKVPRKALTVGIATILDAKEVLVLINGLSKARALHHAVEDSIGHMWTVTSLQMHKRGIIVCDYDACAEIKMGTYRYFLEIEKDHLDPSTLLK